MLSSQSGVSDSPKPGCSGRDHVVGLRKLCHVGQPCRAARAMQHEQRAPAPPRIRRMRQPFTEIVDVVGSPMAGAYFIVIIRESG